MSFSLSVVAGPAAEFSARASAAKTTLESQSEGNDYALTQIASATADAAIKAASDLVTYLAGDSEGTASGSISGHHATDPSQTSNASVSVAFTPTAKATAT